MSSGEFGHISEFYQTLLLLCIFALAGFEGLTFLYNTSENYLRHLINEHIAYQQWFRHKSESLQTAQQSNPQQEQQMDLQKSVTNYVQNEITNMEKAHEQPIPNQPQSNQPSFNQPQSNQPSFNQPQSNQPYPNYPNPNPVPQQQLPKKQQTFFTIYVAYNNFISEKLAILVPLLIVGILTTSTYVYTLVAFFCSFLCDLIVEVLDAEEKAHRVENSDGEFGLKQGVKLLGNAFILSIFFSYWSVTQFTPS